MKTNEGLKGVVAHVMCEKYIKLKVTRTCLLSRFLRGFKNQLVVSDCSQNAHTIKKRLFSYNYYKQGAYQFSKINLRPFFRTF